MDLDFARFPKKPGVYLMKGEEDVILYVGKAKELRTRIKQYFTPGRDGRMMVPFLTSQVLNIDTIITPSEREALLLESTLIKRHQPKYNILLKDDKTYISLMVNHKHPWPMVRLVRYKGKPKKDGLYFGPYTNGLAAKETLNVINKIFPLRQCSDNELASRKRPCLLYSIKRCIAPCVNKCTHEEYDTYVDKTVKFLKGQSKEIIDILRAEMETASENMEYERAGTLLRKIRGLEDVSKQSKALVRAKISDCDAISLYRVMGRVLLVQLIFREGRLIGSESFPFKQVAADNEEILESFLLQNYVKGAKLPKEILLPSKLSSEELISDLLSEMHGQKIHLLLPLKGEKKELLDLAYENAQALFEGELQGQGESEEILLKLQEMLGLIRCPLRIECFDNSHISASDPVACMIAFTDGKKDRARTRLYKIKTAKESDDYGAMKEVLTRRYTKAKEEDDFPDLVIVDGGKGQLGVAIEVFKDLDIANVDLIAVTKDAGRHDRGMTQEKVYKPEEKNPILLPAHSPLLFLLQRMRDEAHRVAIGFHRKRRKKRVITSKLDNVPGIGQTKKSRLLKHFKSVKKIIEASDEEILSIQGVSKKDLLALREHLS